MHPLSGQVKEHTLKYVHVMHVSFAGTTTHFYSEVKQHIKRHAIVFPMHLNILISICEGAREKGPIAVILNQE